MENSPYLSPLKRFWRLLKPDNKEITFLYVYAFFIGIVQLSLPLGIQSIINLIQGGQMSTSLIILILFVIIGVIVSGALHLNQLRITENFQQKIFVRAAFEFAYRIPKIKLEALYKHYSPELMNRFFDIVSIQKGLSKILLDFSTASIQTVFGLLLLSLYHPFFIVFSLILIILIYSIFKFTSKKGLKTSLVESKNKYNVANWLEELARSSICFKLAGTSTLYMNRIDTSVNSYIAARDEHFKILRKQYLLMIVFKVLVAAGLLIVGSILVIDQHINIGQFVAAEIIILLVISSVEKLILSLETIYDVLTSLEKVGQITDLPIELDEDLVLPEHHHEKGLKVDLNKVTFSYPEQEETILKNVSLEIKANEKVVIKGIGETIKEGEEILTLVPANFDFAAEIFVDPIDLPLLQVKEKVRLQFDGWPAIVFSGWPNVSHGTYGGEIYAIDRYISQNGKYRVLIKPDPDDYPWPEALRFGSGVSSMILLKDVPIWYELWRKIDGFPPDYYKNETPKTEKK